MFKIAETTELNQISLTGARALVLIGILSTKPRSLEDIRNFLLHLKLIEDKHSNDTLRIDLNTIKFMGCELDRPIISTGYKYVLRKHPFSFRASEDEINVLKKVYNYVKKTSDLSVLMEYDELFKKIAFYICDEESKEAILGISILKYYDLQLIKDLLQDCNHKRTLELIYNKADSSQGLKKDVIAQEIVLKNDKLYLYGVDLYKHIPTVLNLRRIKTILARRIHKNAIETSQFKTKFILKDVNELDLSFNEKIIERDGNNLIVEGSYFNNFVAMQRIFSFGKNCIVIEPESFKKKIIEKIREMSKIYG